MRPCKRRVILGLAASLGLFLLIYITSSNDANNNSVNPKFRRKPKSKNGGLIDESEVRYKIKSGDRQAEYIDKKGMHVVVGKYVGDSLGEKEHKFTDEELNVNNYDPRPGAGDNGEPVATMPRWESDVAAAFHDLAGLVFETVAG